MSDAHDFKGDRIHVRGIGNINLWDRHRIHWSDIDALYPIVDIRINDECVDKWNIENSRWPGCFAGFIIHHFG